MEKPKAFGFIRNSGLKQDTAYLIMEEIKKADLSPEIRFKYFELLTKLALHHPRKPGKQSKKGKLANKRKAQSESTSSTDWGKKIGGVE